MPIFMPLLFFGGVFPVLIYDNLTTAVQKVLLGRKRLNRKGLASSPPASVVSITR